VAGGIMEAQLHGHLVQNNYVLVFPEGLEICEVIFSDAYTGLGGEQFVDVLVRVNITEVDDISLVSVCAEAWCGGALIDENNKTIDTDGKVVIPLAIHEVDDTSYKISLYYKGMRVGEPWFKASEKDLYIAGADVSIIDGVIHDKAEVTVSVYNAGVPREPGSITVTVYSTIFVDPLHTKVSAANNETIASNQLWETTITIDIVDRAASFEISLMYYDVKADETVIQAE
jgi:hypothetical protein